jgi:hypothetical protein
MSDDDDKSVISLERLTTTVKKSEWMLITQLSYNSTVTNLRINDWLVRDLRQTEQKSSAWQHNPSSIDPMLFVWRFCHALQIAS